MFNLATIKDPPYYLRCVADRATAQELGVERALAASEIVAYELEDGTRLEAGDVKALRRQVKVQGLRLADGREVALDQVEVLRDGRKVTRYRLADKTEVKKEDAKRVTLSRRRLAAYRLADGTELSKDQVRAITAVETGEGLVDSEGQGVAPGLVAIREQDTGRILGYYSEHGEAPGEWIGKGAIDDLRLTGRISLDENREVYERLMAGLDPVTGERLTQGPAAGERVSGFDGLFTLPKSVSILWGLTDDPEVRAAIEAAYKESVRDAFAWYESQVSVARRGHASSGENDPYPETIHHVPTTGLIAGMFLHRATRPGKDDPCGDPHLHVHVTMTNLAHCEDGQWNALDSTLLHTLARPTGFVEQAGFRLKLTQKLATLGKHIEWTPPVNGSAEIRGLDDRKYIEHFSRRSAEADAALERKGLIDTVGTAPSTARDQAGHETRRAKESGLATAELVADWQARGLEVGLGPEQLAKALQMGKGGQYVEAVLDRKMADALAKDLTEQKNTFGLLDAIQAVANRARSGMTVARAVELAKELTHPADRKASQIQVLRQEVRTVIRRDDGRVVKVRLNDEMAECFTTKEVIRLELEVLAIAKQRRFAEVGRARPEAIVDALKAYNDARPPDRKLGEDQEAMVEGLCIDGAGVALALSPPGFGKTSALLPAKEAWEASGFTVWATAQMAARAHELGAGVGLDPKATMTIAALRQRVEGTPEQPVGTPLPKGVILLVDEVSVVDLRDLVHLERHVRDANGKLVLVGDPQQLGSIGPGAPLYELPKLVPTYELKENRRQVEDWEREALKDLRAAAEVVVQTAEDAATKADLLGKAMDAYDAHDRIVYAEGESRQAKADLIVRAAQEYLAVKDRGQTVALMASYHKDRIALNAVIRAELVRSGEIEAEGMKVGDLEIAVGDTLQVKKNSRKLGLDNSDLVHVEQIDPERKSAMVRRPDGELVEVDRPYLTKWATYGYARTVNNAMGDTEDVGLALVDSSSLSSQWAQVALTRGRLENKAFFTGPRPVDPEHHLPEEKVPDQEHLQATLAVGIGRDRSKELASQVIAALDRDDRPAAVAVLEEAVDDSQAMAQWARERQAAEDAQAAKAAAAKAAEQQAARLAKWNAAAEREARTYAAAGPEERARLDAVRMAKELETVRAAEAAKTPEQREADRAASDDQYDRDHKERDQGLQRTL